MSEVLQIKNLCVSFGSEKNKQNVIDDLTFDVSLGETLGIVGESGSGKSVTSLAVMRLLSERNSFFSGEIIFDGKNLLSLNPNDMRKIRGNKIAMIFQEPMTSLNPLISCGKQIMEPLRIHYKISKEEAKEKTLDLLRLCGIPEPAQRFDEYPHKLSGGMRQRIMIAAALSCGPELLIADEPTTALDVTIQAQILELMKDLKTKVNMSIMMITHDLGIVANTCDRVIIMYCGQIVEMAPTSELFSSPLHPYTKGLLLAIPKLHGQNGRLEAIEGMVPDLKDMPAGCRFNPRCKFASEICKTSMPALRAVSETRMARCHLLNPPEGGHAL